MRVFYEDISENSINKMESKTMDPILTPSLSRFTLFPIKYPEIWNMVKQAQSVVWFAEEIDLNDDLRDYEKLNKDEKHFLKYVLAFFAASDGIVMENLDVSFSSEVQIPEARAFYAFQEMMESVHSETYSLLIDTYVKDVEEKKHLFNAIETIPIIRKKAIWAMNFFSSKSDLELNSGPSFAERLVAFAAVEGIQFSGSFCAIFWLKKRGLMPGLSTSNLFISRDEGLHRDFAVLLHKTLQPENRLSEKRAHEIIREAVELECEFVTEALPVSLIGMNCDLMQQYVKFVGDHLLTSLGFNKIYNTVNPFDWMFIGMEGKTNFFEKRNTEYVKAGVGVDKEQMKFSLDDDF